MVTTPTLGRSTELGLQVYLTPMREEQIPGELTKVVYYNLGKFSQVISDYEQIHFQSDPRRKYEGFTDFLLYQAPHYYFVLSRWPDEGH